MKYFQLAPLLFLFPTCCKAPIDPCLHIPVYDIESLALNDIDENRLCLAEALSKLFKEEAFRGYIQQESIKEDENWNREYILSLHLNQESYNGKTLAEHLDEVIKDDPGLCIHSIEELEERLLLDPLLVLKLPDLIPAEKWNVIETVPFLYVQTRELVNVDSVGGNLSIVGLHPSGELNRYQNGLPDYFPFVLKQSEDYLLIDESLILSNGVAFNSLHSNIPSEVYGSPFINSLPKIENTDLGLIAINDLLKYINQIGIDSRAPYPFDEETCIEDCDFDCIPEDKRKLIVTEASVHSQNTNALNYEYESVYRPYSRTIIFDNILPLFFTKHVMPDNSNSWNRILLGSIRLNDFFDVELEHSVTYHKCQVNGEVFQLPSIDLSFDVVGKKIIPVDDILLMEFPEYDDLLRVGFFTIKLDMAPEQYTALDGGQVAVSYFYENGVINYHGYCYSGLIGFNSVALHSAY